MILVSGTLSHTKLNNLHTDYIVHDITITKS